MVIAGLDSLEGRLLQSELRLVPVFGEGHCYQGLVTGFALGILPGEGEDEPLGLDDLAEELALL